MTDLGTLISPAAAGVPAPFWFVQFFKILGFTLHAVPMNLWFAGLLVGLWLHLRGSAHGRQFGGRLLQQMPVLVAAGVNLGIVPLLFIQLAYYKVFYPATILMAWSWLAIVVLLIPAYYGVYAYAWGLHDGVKTLARWRWAAGWLAAFLFICIGFIFSNGLSLMEHVERWPDLWNRFGDHGATLGTAMNTGDATMWPRWLLMLGLALGTTAAWIVFDAEWFAARSTDDAYRRWAWGFARKLYTVGMIWAAIVGSWYVFITWSDTLQKVMFHGRWLPLTLATGAATGLPWLLLMAFGRREKNRAAAAFVALAQFGVLGINAISRQVVQNVNLLHQRFDVSSQPVDVQWSPLAMFLIVFVVALLVLAWMIAQVVRCGSKNECATKK